MADTVTVMEKIGHYLDDEVTDLYQECKNNGLSKRDASPVIAEKLDIPKILRGASKGWDGGYVMAGLLGHGDAFVLRDPAGIRPAYFYEDDEIAAITNLNEEQVETVTTEIPVESSEDIVNPISDEEITPDPEDENPENGA
jgi:amidophosphoribosyltransferase